MRRVALGCLNSGPAEPFSPVSTMSIVVRQVPREAKTRSASPITSASVFPTSYAASEARTPSSFRRKLSSTLSSSSSDLTARAVSKP